MRIRILISGFKGLKLAFHYNHYCDYTETASALKCSMIAARRMIKCAIDR